MSTKLQLLKLSKKELIKKCKSHNINTNGTKSDMVDRLLKSKPLSTSSKKLVSHKTNTKKKKKKKRKMEFVPKTTEFQDKLQQKQQTKQIEQEPISIKQPYFYHFKPNTITQENNTSFNNTFRITVIFNILMEYLPIYTLSNLMSCFPNYNYSDLKIMKTALDTEKRFDYEDMHRCNFPYIFNYFDGFDGKYKISHDNNQSILEFMIKDYLTDNEQQSIFEYGELYTMGDESISCSVQFNKTDIYNINQLLTLYVGIRQNELYCYLPSKYVQSEVDKIINMIDNIGLNDIINFDIFNDKQQNGAIIIFVCSFLELILSFNNKSKHTVFSSIYTYRYIELEQILDEGSDGEIEKESYTFIFKDNCTGNINKIHFMTEEQT